MVGCVHYKKALNLVIKNTICQLKWQALTYNYTKLACTLQEQAPASVVDILQLQVQLDTQFLRVLFASQNFTTWWHMPL